MNCKSNPSAVSCKECMGNAPYNWCCRDECGEHELCRGCERYIGECKPAIHGHWENVENAKNTIRCSNCGHFRELKHFSEIIKRPKFCEMCSAKMDESEG